MKIRNLILIACALGALFSTGCTSTHFKQGDVEFSRISILNKQSIGRVDVQAADKKLSIEGYSNEQTEIAAAVAGSVAKALAPVALAK